VGTLLVIVLALLAVGAYYFFTTQLVSLERLRAQMEMEHYSDLTSQYVQISSAVATIEGNITNFTVHIINTSENPIPIFTAASWYLYRDGALIARGVGSCGPAIGPETPCTLYFSVLTDKLPPPTEFSTLSLKVYVNRVPLAARVSFAGNLPGSPVFFQCKDCSSCNAVISAAKPSALIAVDVSSASGSCLDINGKSNLTIFCISTISGSGSGTGIAIVDSNNITLRNCEVLNFSKGIYLRNSNSVSLLSVYAHDNAQDIYLDPSTPNTLCNISTVEAATTSGPLYALRSTSGSSYTLYRAGGIWVTNSSDVSFTGSSLRMSRVSPAIALCSSDTVSISYADVNDVDYGVLLHHDSNTSLRYIGVLANKQDISSSSSMDSTLCCSSFSSPFSLFDLPTDVLLDDDVNFN